MAVVSVLGCGVFVYALTRLNAGDLAGVAVFVPLAILAQLIGVALPSGGGRTAPSTMVYIAGIVLLSPAAAAVVPFVAMAICELFRRPRWYKALFNTAEYTLSIFAAALTWSWTAGDVRSAHDLLGSFPAAVLASLVYYLLNTWFVNVVIVLERGGGLWESWWANHRNDVLPRISMHVMGILFAAAWLYDPRAIALLLVPAGVTWASFRQVRALELKTRSEQLLREKSEQLAARWETLASVSAQLGECVGADAVLAKGAALVVAHCADAARLRAGGRTATAQRAGAPTGLLDDRGSERVRELPLRVGADVGTLEAAWADSGPTDDQTALLDQLADRIAVALENALLLEQGAEVEAVREVARLKDEFLSAVSHELRSPLALLIGYGELLKERPPAEDEVRWMGERIHRAGEHLARLVDDLLEAGRLESGRFSLDRRRLDPVAAATAALEIARATHPSHGFELRGREGVPEVLADATRLQQVLTNLLSNAARYAPAGTRVTVAIEPDVDHVALAVEDEGLGVPPAERDHVFEKFYRTDEAKQQTKKGLGLGLAICRDLVAAHGGRIWVEDAPGGGARFVFTLPLAEP